MKQGALSTYVRFTCQNLAVSFSYTGKDFIQINTCPEIQP